MTDRQQRVDLGEAAAMDACFEPLAALTRGADIESVHRGAAAVVDVSGRLLGSAGDPSVEVVLRSTAKPFQAAVVVGSGAAKAFAVTDEELAVMCGSHAGEPAQVAVVRGLLDRLGAPDSVLVCGSVEHGCSGKHAGMLLLAKHLGAPLEGYEQEPHPVQRMVEREIRQWLAGFPGAPGRTGENRVGRAPRRLFAGVDGCGVPVLRVSLFEAAWLFAALAAGADPVFARVRDAMMAHPGMVAGEDRFDTRAMRAFSPRLVAKSGAEGVQGLGLLAPGIDRPAVGWFVKIGDGSARPLPALATLFLRSQDMGEQADAIEAEYPPLLRSVRGGQTGRIGLLLDQSDLRRRMPDGAEPGSDSHPLGPPERESVASRLFRQRAPGVTLCRGDEREIVRFLREEWPAADEETFGRPVEWLAEPVALAVRRHHRIVAVLRGHVTGGVGSVDELIVAQSHRGSGLGTLLLERFEQEAASRGCGRVVLRAVKDSKAEHFYRGKGYRRECVQYSYEFGYDYVRMTKLLRHSRRALGGPSGEGRRGQG